MQRLRSSRGAGQGTLAIIAIICIAVATFFIVKQTKQKKDKTYGDVFYYCTSCKKEFVDSSNKVSPIKCKFCAQPTAASLRKYKCKQCGTVFAGFIMKFDEETKRLIERRKRGEKVPEEQIRSELISGPDGDSWVDASSQDAYDLLASISCPKDGASGVDIEAIFPKPASGGKEE